MVVFCASNVHNIEFSNTTRFKETRTQSTEREAFLSPFHSWVVPIKRHVPKGPKSKVMFNKISQVDLNPSSILLTMLLLKATDFQKGWRRWRETTRWWRGSKPKRGGGDLAGSLQTTLLVILSHRRWTKKQKSVSPAENPANPEHGRQRLLWLHQAKN